MSKKTTFQKAWTANPAFSSWLKAVPYDRFSATCTLCITIIYLSNMGKQVLTSHTKSKKHQNAVKSMNASQSLTSILATSSPKPTEEPVAVANQNSALSEASCSEVVVVSHNKNQTNLSSFLSRENIAKAEILWCLYTVAEHASFNASTKCVNLFSLMFTDSDIAKKMSLQRTKLSYSIVYGLAPYFSSSLLDILKNCSVIAVGFDESLNKISQKQQMDILVRFWHPEKNRVSTQYLTSEFLGHTTAEELLKAFKRAISPVGTDKILQVAMDGPNVNLKFLRDLNSELSTSPTDPQLLDLGTCGLHTINCAFKTAITVTGWKVVNFLTAAYYLFKDVPARRADYMHYTSSSVFPKKFCYIRWIENVDVAQRAIEVLPYINLFIECAIRDKKNIL